MSTWDQLEGRRISACLTLISGLSIDKRNVRIPLSKCSGCKMRIQRLLSVTWDFTFLRAFEQSNLEISSIVRNLNTVTRMKHK